MSGALSGAAPRQATPEQDPALHGLRGIAVLFVLLSHLGSAGFFLVPVPHDRIGKVGVWIFFVLSAFLLTRRLLAETRDGRSLRAACGPYAIHRVFRIYPMLAVALLLHVLARDFDVPMAARHLLLVEGAGELWAIPVECFYYVLIPVVAAFAAKSSRNAFLFLAALGCLSMAACIVEPARTFDNSLSWLHKAAPFLAGSALALWTARRPAPPGRARPIAALAWLVAFGLLTGLYRELSFDRLAPAAAPWLSLGLAGAVAGLLHACGRHGWWRRTLASPALVWIGQVSFSLYLTHGFVIAVVRRLPVPSSTLAAWLSMALALALAGCCYRCIEKPGIRIGRRWGLRWAARPPTGARAPD